MKTRRDQILGTTQDLVSNYLYYNRKEDENLPPGGIEEAIQQGEVTIEELVTIFADGLRRAVAASPPTRRSGC